MRIWSIVLWLLLRVCSFEDSQLRSSNVVGDTPCPSQLSKAKFGSRSWVNEDGSKHLHLVIIAEPWIPFSLVTIIWQDSLADVTTVVGGTIMAKSAGSVEIELDPQVPATRNIQVEVSDTLDEHPTIGCTARSALPPALPHPQDCILDPKYTLVRMWDSGAIAQVELEVWQEGKTMTLTYYGQEIQIEPKSLSNVLLDGTPETDHGNTVVRFHLVPESYLHGGKQIFTFQVQPAPRQKPRIECHAPWSPAPPGSPPPPNPWPPLPRPPPLPPPASPPPVRKILAHRGCAAGGEMEMSHWSLQSGKDHIRIVVRLSKVDNGYDVICRFSHAWDSPLDIAELTDAILLEQNLSPAADETTLVIKPNRRATSFGFDLIGTDIALRELSCKPSESWPPPSPDPPSPPVLRHKTQGSHKVHVNTQASSTDDNGIGWIMWVLGFVVLLFGYTQIHTLSMICSHLKKSLGFLQGLVVERTPYEGDDAQLPARAKPVRRKGRGGASYDGINKVEPVVEPSQLQAFEMSEGNECALPMRQKGSHDSRLGHWLVLVQTGSLETELRIAKSSSVKSMMDLKRAIVRLGLKNLGDLASAPMWSLPHPQMDVFILDETGEVHLEQQTAKASTCSRHCS